MILTCEFCEKKFEANRASRKYCSRECYQRHRTLTRTIMKKCACCGELFRVSISQAETLKHCSQKCSDRSKQGSKLKRQVTAQRKREEAELRRKIKQMTPIGLLKTCATCKYCERAGVPDMWDCWRCTNEGSTYYGSLLNIDINGNAYEKVTWLGCKKWKMEKDCKKVNRKADDDTYKVYSQSLKGTESDKTGFSGKECYTIGKDKNAGKEATWLE